MQTGSFINQFPPPISWEWPPGALTTPELLDCAFVWESRVPQCWKRTWNRKWEDEWPTLVVRFHPQKGTNPSSKLSCAAVANLSHWQGDTMWGKRGVIQNRLSLMWNPPCGFNHAQGDGAATVSYTRPHRRISERGFSSCCSSEPKAKTHIPHLPPPPVGEFPEIPYFACLVAWSRPSSLQESKALVTWPSLVCDYPTVCCSQQAWKHRGLPQWSDLSSRYIFSVWFCSRNPSSSC